MILTVAVIIGFACIGAAQALCMWRLVSGPGVLDRVLALDTLVINTIALIMLFGISYATTMFFEAALLFAMVGFVSTVAFCKFCLRGNIIE